MRLLLLAVVTFLVVGCSNTDPEELPSLDPEQATSYAELLDSENVLHIWPGGECCWWVPNRVYSMNNGCISITANATDLDSHIDYCGEHFYGRLRIDGCGPCLDFMHTP